MRDGRADRGILICGSGVGASVAANKIPGIRAAICHDTYSAHQGVEHDDMNVLTLGSRVIGIEPAVECSIAFLAATFSGEARHQRRLDKVLAIEAGGARERLTPAVHRRPPRAATIRGWHASTSRSTSSARTVRRSTSPPTSTRSGRRPSPRAGPGDGRPWPTEVDSRLETVQAADVTFSGFDGQPIKAWLLWPAGRPGPLPAIVEYIGYGGGRGRPVDWLVWASAGLRAPRDGHARPGRRAGARATPPTSRPPAPAPRSRA